jgi:hypothetical protein
MKKILIFILGVILMCGCAERDHSYDDKMPFLDRVIVIDSCEYIEGTYALTHKGNCKYCAARRKAEMEEVINNLKLK